MNPAWGLPWGPKEIDLKDDLTRMMADPGGETDFRVLQIGQKTRGGPGGDQARTLEEH